MLHVNTTNYISPHYLSLSFCLYVFCVYVVVCVPPPLQSLQQHWPSSMAVLQYSVYCS